MRRCSPEIPNISGLYRAVIGLSICVVACETLVWADAVKPHSTDAYEAITGDTSEEDRSRWDAIFSSKDYIYGRDPAPFVKANINLLPVGRALDLAMAEGRNAVFLARRGFKVDGVDISEVALRKARRLARENNVMITTINEDLKRYQIKPNSYDAILDIQFLWRPLLAQIKRGLKKGGVVIIENYTEEQLSNPNGKSISKEFCLKKGELREAFKDFIIIFDRETNDGKDAVARFIAKKP